MQAKKLFAALLALALGASLPAQERSFDHSHEQWTEVLGAHLSKDRFDYGALLAKREGFNRYIKALESVEAQEFKTWDAPQRHAYWINAYNAFTVQLIADHYGPKEQRLKSILDIGTAAEGTWDQRFIALEHLHPLEGQHRLSLNDIEHKILRPGLKDPRVHAAVNCASVGCPPLAKEAFTFKNLDAALERQVKQWLRDPLRNKIHREQKTLRLSKIFEWYAEDFPQEKQAFGDWLAKFAVPEFSEWLATGDFQVLFLEYDWTLNDVLR
ncbi:MAG: hypothetical protein ACI9F9_000270 [Candidatus Paceibacteria bacterium]|jgi:hypothetical protein